MQGTVASTNRSARNPSHLVVAVGSRRQRSSGRGPQCIGLLTAHGSRPALTVGRRTLIQRRLQQAHQVERGLGVVVCRKGQACPHIHFQSEGQSQAVRRTVTVNGSESKIDREPTVDSQAILFERRGLSESGLPGSQRGGARGC